MSDLISRYLIKTNALLVKPYEDLKAERDKLLKELDDYRRYGHKECVDEVESVKAERDRLRRVLEQIANDGCGLSTWTADNVTCVDTCPDDKSEWCWCCIARHALVSLKEEGKP